MRQWNVGIRDNEKRTVKAKDDMNAGIEKDMQNFDLQGIWKIWQKIGMNA